MSRLKAFLLEDNEYFTSCKSSITSKNKKMLAEGCAVYAAVLAFYTVFVKLTKQSNALEYMYYVFDAIHLCLCAAVFVQTKRKKKSFRSTQALCAALEITVLSFFALEGVFASRTQHSLYVPIAILLVLLLFIHKALYASLIIFLYTGSFAVLSVLYKTPEAYTNDVYIAIATFISANIGYALIAKMRHNEGTVLRKYEDLSRMDALTGLLNKSAIEGLCRSAVAEADHDLAFIIIDIDNFKGVNDEFGHAVGDEVLSLVGRELRSSFRDKDHIGRFGGDEFIVVMDECENREIILDRVERITKRVADLKCSAPRCSVHCSAGIALKGPEDSFESLFKRADHALYTAKSAGKGCYRMADEDEHTGHEKKFAGKNGKK